MTLFIIINYSFCGWFCEWKKKLKLVLSSFSRRWRRFVNLCLNCLKCDWKHLLMNVDNESKLFRSIRSFNESFWLCVNWSVLGSHVSADETTRSNTTAAKQIGFRGFFGFFQIFSKDAEITILIFVRILIVSLNYKLRQLLAISIELWVNMCVKYKLMKIQKFNYVMSSWLAIRKNIMRARYREFCYVFNFFEWEFQFSIASLSFVDFNSR